MKINIGVFVHVLIFFLAVYGPVQAKVFTRCPLAKELLNQRISRTFISNWVCLIEHVSGSNTSKVTTKPNGHSNYGLFQISSKKYCKIGKKGGFCNIACESLLNDDISDDVACANYIFGKEGFKAWPTWVKYCKDLGNDRLPDVHKCPDWSRG